MEGQADEQGRASSGSSPPARSEGLQIQASAARAAARIRYTGQSRRALLVLPDAHRQSSPASGRPGERPARVEVLEEIALVRLVPAHLRGGDRAEVQPVQVRRGQDARRRPSSAVRTVTASVGPSAAGISSAGTSTTLANGKRNSRLASGCSGESQRTTVGQQVRRALPAPRARGPDRARSRPPPRDLDGRGRSSREMRSATSGVGEGRELGLRIVLGARDDRREPRGEGLGDLASRATSSRPPRR